jgi:hypothetical protein
MKTHPAYSTAVASAALNASALPGCAEAAGPPKQRTLQHVGFAHANFHRAPRIKFSRLWAVNRAKVGGKEK